MEGLISLSRREVSGIRRARGRLKMVITPKRLIGEEQPPVSSRRFEEVCKYIRSKKGIRDVPISGGDPLMLSTGVQENYIKKLRTIPHLHIIRIGTRVPATLPMRIDTGRDKHNGRAHGHTTGYAVPTLVVDGPGGGGKIPPPPPASSRR